MTNVAVLISGRGSNMTALVEQARGYRVVLVASARPEAPGLAWARDHGIPAVGLPTPARKDKTRYEAALDRVLHDAGVEVIALAGYMRLLSADFVARWRGRIVNIHPSLLPLYKGLDTHARALAAGDTHAGCSVHLVTEELDAGRVLGQVRVPIVPGDTADTLAARVLAAEHRLYPRTLAEFVMSPIDRVRSIALRLPDTGEQAGDGAATFLVDDRPFARLEEGGALQILSGDDGDWTAISLDGDCDWQRVEDAVARSWELAAPTGQLEAGGR